MSRWLWVLSGWGNRLWLRASLYGLAAVAAALISIIVKDFIPEGISRTIGADAVDDILNILASSMLVVTTFSLSTMVAAYGAATSNVTPRATQLLIEDKSSQNALSTFIGAFVFSLVGIVTLKAGVYGDSGRLVLFGVTIIVLVMMIVTLLRWIEYLSRLGRVNETVRMVEDAATAALLGRLKKPYLGGEPFLHDDESVPQGHALYVEETGYVQHIDMGALARFADKHGCKIYIRSTPGKLADIACPLAVVKGLGQPDEAQLKTLRKAFIVGSERSFRQDPRYGMAVLHEIAIRALSPAVNDPGTAIHVIGVGVRVLSHWQKRTEYLESADVEYAHVYVPPLRIEDLFDDFFPPIARDGAGILEVLIRLHKAYISLHAAGDSALAEACVHHAALTLKRGLSALALEEDQKALAAAIEPFLADNHAASSSS